MQIQENSVDLQKQAFIDSPTQSGNRFTPDFANHAKSNQKFAQRNLPHVQSSNRVTQPPTRLPDTCGAESA